MNSEYYVANFKTYTQALGLTKVKMHLLVPREGWPSPPTGTGGRSPLNKHRFLRARNDLVTGLIPGWGTRLGCRPAPWLGACKRQLIDVSLAHGCFSLSLSFSLPSL